MLAFHCGSLHAELESGPEDEDDGWLRAEAVQVYQQLRGLALQLNTGHDDDSGTPSMLHVPPSPKIHARGAGERAGTAGTPAMMMTLAELESGPEDADDGWLRAEAVQVYQQLRGLALQLNTGRDDDSVNENDDEDEDDDDDEQVQTESEHESDMEIDL
ncbi:unnamed protein product [Plutella xylostella]|uniref:(diamondback moth) hypothetical protein n=1 Tax=Plutella xylostella TaxID=51655 RepID=A0A8S4DR06_PLUXY|nr:unnamed protein product [Plutella xylostella]